MGRFPKIWTIQCCGAYETQVDSINWLQTRLSLTYIVRVLNRVSIHGKVIDFIVEAEDLKHCCLRDFCLWVCFFPKMWSILKTQLGQSLVRMSFCFAFSLSFSSDLTLSLWGKKKKSNLVRGTLYPKYILVSFISLNVLYV